MGSKKSNSKKHNKKKGKDNSKPEDSQPSNVNLINDPRFSAAHTDPRFREAPKHETKVAIDSRFKRMFTDKSFLSSSAPVDKRGKPKDKSTSQSDSLRHYYKIDSEVKKKVEHSSDDEDTEEEELVEDDKGVKSEETTDSELESATASDTDANIDTDTDTDESVDYEEDTPDIQEEITEIEKETHRLAVVNMDWRFVKAADLYVLLNSFVPDNGLVKSVSIYPTEFGLQRMKEEEVRGPVALFDDEDGDDEDDEANNEKLRAYEKSKMRYYCAVVECDSVATADHIYRECDGIELSRSSNPIDLRFIPDNMEFKQPPKDVATERPANYEYKDFYSRALQLTEVENTWDEDEPLREKSLKRKFTDDQLDQLELEQYVASDKSDSDDGEDSNETDDQPDKNTRKKDKYRALLLLGNGSDEDAEQDGVQDMEVTFNPGLEDISKHFVEKKDKKSETVWKESLRKSREKKKARKNKSKYSSDDDDSDDADQEATEDADDFFIEEPAVENGKKGQSKNDKDHKLQDMDGGDQASKEELELLLADDKGTDTGLKGYNLKFKKGKGKKRENAIDEGKIPNSAYDDPRFADLLSPDYAIDPTDPQFKRSASYARQLVQKQAKGHKELSPEREPTKLSKETRLSSDGSGMMQKGEEEEGLDALKSKRDKIELSSLVKSIKRKSKEVQLSSDGKTGKHGKSQFKSMGKRRH